MTKSLVYLIQKLPDVVELLPANNSCAFLSSYSGSAILSSCWKHEEVLSHLMYSEKVKKRVAMVLI